MNKVKRILLVVLCIMLCTSSILIPISAGANHTCSFNHFSHGSGIPFSGTSTTCSGTNYYQCVYKCACGNSTMKSHAEGGGSHSWDSMPQTPTGGYNWQCSKCGAWKS